MKIFLSVLAFFTVGFSAHAGDCSFTLTNKENFSEYLRGRIIRGMEARGYYEVDRHSFQSVHLTVTSAGGRGTGSGGTGSGAGGLDWSKRMHEARVTVALVKSPSDQQLLATSKVSKPYRNLGDVMIEAVEKLPVCHRPVAPKAGLFVPNADGGSVDSAS